MIVNRGKNVEAFLMVKAASRAELASAEGELSPMVLRWIAEITADGSEIRSLGGRSARIADGLSRNVEDLAFEQTTHALLYQTNGLIRN